MLVKMTRKDKFYARKDEFYARKDDTTCRRGRCKFTCQIYESSLCLIFRRVRGALMLVACVTDTAHAWLLRRMLGQ